MSDCVTTSTIRPNRQAPSTLSPRATIAATGQAKNTAKNATGTAMSPSRAALPARSLWTAASVTSVRARSTT